MHLVSSSSKYLLSAYSVLGARPWMVKKADPWSLDSSECPAPELSTGLATFQVSLHRLPSGLSFLLGKRDVELVTHKAPFCSRSLCLLAHFHLASSPSR